QCSVPIGRSACVTFIVDGLILGDVDGGKCREI
ncbi:unnamed protein product, partial [Rotaria socialis]